MDLGIQGWFTSLLGVQSVTQFGAKQYNTQDGLAHSETDCSAYFDTSSIQVGAPSILLIKQNIAVIPDDWTGSGVGAPWLNAKSADEVFVRCMTQLKSADFIAFHDDFIKFIGIDAQMSIVHSFQGEDIQHVHEAPVFLPQTNELLFADTSVVGWLWIFDVKTNKIRKVGSVPPLQNVNGGTLHDQRLFLTTNGGTAPAVVECSLPAKASAESEEEIHCTPIVNNFRLNHLNSPNDLIFTKSGNILFTDPTYGWAQSWPGVGPPELPTAIYHFNVWTRTLTVLDHEVNQPNGLALSTDEKTLYVADSNSTSGKPIGVWQDSVRNVFAFEFNEQQLSVSNKRLVHVVERGWPDGVRITKSKEGKELLLVASMGGVDVVDVSRAGAGKLLGKFNVGDDIIFNLEPVQGKSARGGSAKDKGVWFLTGKKAVYKVEIASG